MLSSALFHRSASQYGQLYARTERQGTYRCLTRSEQLQHTHTHTYIPWGLGDRRPEHLCEDALNEFLFSNVEHISTQHSVTWNPVDQRCVSHCKSTCIQQFLHFAVIVCCPRPGLLSILVQEHRLGTICRCVKLLIQIRYACRALLLALDISATSWRRLKVHVF